MFGRTAPVEIEIGAGKGEFIIERAAEFPERDFIAVELDGSGTPTRIEHFEDAFGEEYNPSVGL